MKGNKCGVEKNKSAANRLIGGIFGDGDNAFSRIFYIECMDRRMDMPLSNLKKFWAEYGLVVCMNQGRGGRTNEQKHEETEYFSWHGEPPDDV